MVFVHNYFKIIASNGLYCIISGGTIHPHQPTRALIMTNRNIKFTNGVEMNQQNPDTYHIPSEAEKAAVKPGDNVKVGVAVAGRVNSEKFWVLVTENDTANQIITGTVNNDLVCTDSHGLVDGDTITVPYHAILDNM